MDDARSQSTITPWLNGERHITSVAETPSKAVGAALEGVLAVYREGSGTEEQQDEGSVALAFRAEGSDLSQLTAELATALLEDVDHESYDVQSVQFNSFVRTESGYAGWGYAIGVPGHRSQQELTVSHADVQSALNQTSVSITVRR